LGIAVVMGYSITLKLWNGAHARAIGRDHVKNGTPCQDRTGLVRRKGVICASLADGAGSRPMSHIGAEAAVEAAGRILTDRFDELSKFKKNKAVKSLYQDLLRAVKAAADKAGLSSDDMASTLLAVAVRGNRYLACHVGDGAIVQVSKKGARMLSVPEGGEFANQTVFLTGKDGAKSLRLYRGKVYKGTKGFVLMSDGPAASLYRKRNGAFQPARACASMVDWCASAGEKQVSSALELNLSTLIRERTGDDCSLAVLGASIMSPSELAQTEGSRRSELLGTDRKNYHRTHMDYLRDLEYRGESVGTKDRAIKLEVARSTVRRHRERLKWEVLNIKEAVE